MPVLSPTPENIARAVAQLRGDGLVGLPTETVYGLAARGDHADAVAKIFAAKGRPANNPLILHVGSVQAAADLMNWDSNRTAAERFEKVATLWPGPLTVIGPKQAGVPECVTAGGSTVGVRIPSHPIALELLGLSDFPVAAPSANRSNYISPTLARHVVDGLGDAVDLVLDGGPCDVGLESTILTLGDEKVAPTILRLGALSADAIADALGEPVTETTRRTVGQRDRSVMAPGQFKRHYSPHTPLLICETKARSVSATPPMPNNVRVLRIIFGDVKNDPDGTMTFRSLCPDGDLNHAAAHLYDVLRQADAEDFDRIEIEACDETTSLGRAIMDRIRRAAAQ